MVNYNDYNLQSYKYHNLLRNNCKVKPCEQENTDEPEYGAGMY